MTTITRQSSAHALEAIGRGPWTSRDWYALFLFLAQSLGIVCAGVFLYSLGPALGVGVLCGSLVVWSGVRKYFASTNEQPLADDHSPSGRASSRCDGATPRRGESTATDSRPVVHQSA